MAESIISFDIPTGIGFFIIGSVVALFSASFLAALPVAHFLLCLKWALNQTFVYLCVRYLCVCFRVLLLFLKLLLFDFIMILF